MRLGRRRDGNQCYEPWSLFFKQTKTETVTRHRKSGASTRYSKDSECPESLVCSSKRKRETEKLGERRACRDLGSETRNLKHSKTSSRYPVVTATEGVFCLHDFLAS